MIPSKHEFDNVISKILSRNEYRHLNKHLSDFINKLKEKIAYWIFKKLENANWDISPSIPEKLSTFFIIIGILLIMGIIILVLVIINKGFERARKVKEILGEKIDENTTPKSLRNRATGFQEQGDFRQAIRYNFISLLLLMHEKRVLYLEESKTNYEICQLLQENNFPEVSIFQDLVILFNLSWYGHQKCPQETYENWLDDFNLVWNEVINYEKKNK
ncbi:hypothetical protein [Halocella sp. SP3-1]|uniref:hypothetical protein n=1 Tax=Halocella sp. SP3-1 TaxID=2382161 RepID=UPI000F7603AA|nr:hypothetical protein [Halocella sp. SP3-1]AZO95441.1 hypothetical protein D7D81_13030 [Halocella sp. SP3-1]